MKQDDIILRNTDGVFSWKQFWAYFSSDICTDEMRAWTMRHLHIIDCIKGTTPEVQYEILESAPRVLITHPSVLSILHPNVRQKLRVSTETKTGISDELRRDFIKDFKKLKKGSFP